MRALPELNAAAIAAVTVALYSTREHISNLGAEPASEFAVGTVMACRAGF